MGLSGIACFTIGYVGTTKFIYNTQKVLSKETMHKLIDNVGNLNCAATATGLKNALEKEGLYTDKIQEIFETTRIVTPEFIWSSDTGEAEVVDNTKLAFKYGLVNK
jgi:endonuclease III